MIVELIKDNIKIKINKNISEKTFNQLNRAVLSVDVKYLDKRQVKITFNIKRKIFNKKMSFIANEMYAKKPKEWGFDGLQGILDLSDSSFYIYYPNKEYKESENSKYFY